MNNCTFTTRIYKDAEQRYTQSGDSIVSFKGPVESGYGQNKVTTWIKFSMFGKRGESVLPYLKDKTQIAVSGELANREYTDKEGQKRYSLEVRVNDLTLLGGKTQESSQAPQQQAKQKPSMDDIDDSIPF
mgnify:FL=1